MAVNNSDLGPLECKVCWVRYNKEDRRPRILNCGHTFCTRCLVTSAGKRTLKCPSCRSCHKINSVSSICINFNVEAVMESIGLLTSPQSTAGICDEHPDYPLFFYCLQHQAWMCYLCKNQNHLDWDGCQVISYKDALLHVKDREHNLLTTQIRLCDGIFKRLETQTSKINATINSHHQEIETLCSRINVLRKSIRVLVGDRSEVVRVHHEGKLGYQELKNAQKILSNATNLTEVDQAMNKIQFWNKVIQEWMDFTEKQCPVPASCNELEEIAKTECSTICKNQCDPKLTTNKQSNGKCGLERHGIVNDDILKGKIAKIVDKMNEQDLHFYISFIEDMLRGSDASSQDNSDKASAINVIGSLKGDCSLPLTSNNDELLLSSRRESQTQMNHVAEEMEPVTHGQTSSMVTPFSIDVTLRVLQKVIPWVLKCRGQIVAAPISTSQQGLEQQHYAEVSEQEKKIHLHSLKNPSYYPSPSSIVLPYEQLHPLAMDCGTLTFLDFDWGSAQGRVYVRLKKNTARGQQFLQLCTGRSGRTYVGTHLQQIYNKDSPGECILIGKSDPEQVLSTNLTDVDYSWRGQYSHPWSPGLVWGGWGTHSALFGITLRHWPGGSPAPSCFGWIECGLEVLQSAVLHPNISQVKIVDCGVVIE